MSSKPERERARLMGEPATARRASTGAPGRPDISGCDGGRGRAASRRSGGYGFCDALHERLAAVCGDLVRAGNRSHVYAWSIGREACAALVAR
jgi:hypothetical protein